TRQPEQESGRNGATFRRLMNTAAERARSKTAGTSAIRAFTNMYPPSRHRFDLQHRMNLPQRPHDARWPVAVTFLRRRLRLARLVEEREPDEPQAPARSTDPSRPLTFGRRSSRRAPSVRAAPRSIDTTAANGVTIADDYAKPHLIRNHYGFGYSFCGDVTYVGDDSNTRTPLGCGSRSVSADSRRARTLCRRALSS